MRLKWDVDGDKNSKLFYEVDNNNMRKNHIHVVRINDIWENDPTKITKEVFDFFSNKFDEPL